MKLFYRKYGEGPALIIVHGLYGSSDNWVTLGKALSDRFEVYLVDQRNHGQSPHSERHDYNAMKEDLREFMDDRAIESAVLMGHSMGGKTVMYFAASYPERVSGLVVVDMSPRSYREGGFPAPRSVDHASILEAMLSLDPGAYDDRNQIDEVFKQKIPVPRVRQFLLKNLKRRKDHRFAWKLNVKSLYNNLDNILDGLDETRFDGGNGITGFPVLFIRGEKSDYIGPQDEVIIKKIFPFAEIYPIPDAGHWVHVEAGDLLLKKVEEFILEV